VSDGAELAGASSGVTAVVVAGVVLGGSRHRLTDASIRLQLNAVYAVVVFLLENVVFSVIGLELPTLVRELPGGTGLWPCRRWRSPLGRPPNGRQRGVGHLHGRTLRADQAQHPILTT
jgi:hypothetical protein